MPLKENFVANIQHACEAKGISRTQLAELTGFSRPYISQILNGHRPLTLETCEKLATAVGINPASAFSSELFVEKIR